MRDVVDPELGINVVDLGLVYGMNFEEGEAGTVALIDMTLTSAACPLTDGIEETDPHRADRRRPGQRDQAELGVEPAGDRTRSPITVASKYALWGSPSDLIPCIGHRADNHRVITVPAFVRRGASPAAR